MIIENTVNLPVAELEDDDSDHRPPLQYWSGDECRRLGHARINRKIRNLCLQQCFRPVEHICQLARS